MIAKLTIGDKQLSDGAVPLPTKPIFTKEARFKTKKYNLLTS